MSVTCFMSHTANDLRCPVCGQGFLLFTGSRMSATAREEVRHRVRLAIRQHHVVRTSGIDVHPRAAFTVDGENRAFAAHPGSLVIAAPALANVC